MGGVVGLWLSRATWLAWFVGLEGLISLGWLRSVECLGMILDKIDGLVLEGSNVGNA